MPGIHVGNQVGAGTNFAGDRILSVAELSPSQYNAAFVDDTGAAITTTAAELNLLDTAVAGTVVASKAVIADSSGAISNVSNHLKLNSALTSTDVTGDTVRINSITNTGTANSFIGLQVKPGQGASTALGITGVEISPRVENTFALTGGGTIIGTSSIPYLKGTAAGTIGGDVRALNLEVVTDDAGTRTVSGNVNHIRIRSAFSATTIAGKFVPIRIEKAEAQTNSKQYDAVLELPSTNGAVWDVKGSDFGALQEPRAKIKVLVNGTAYWLVGYSVEPA